MAWMQLVPVSKKVTTSVQGGFEGFEPWRLLESLGMFLVTMATCPYACFHSTGSGKLKPIAHSHRHEQHPWENTQMTCDIVGTQHPQNTFLGSRPPRGLEEFNKDCP